MSKKCLIISKSTEMVHIAPENIVYFKADGNYCYMQADNDASIFPPSVNNNDKEKENKENRRLIYFQLGQVENMIEEQLGEGQFIRIGKSLIVNRDCIYYIHIQKQLLLLADSQRKLYHLDASSAALRQLKDALEKELEEELKKKSEENNGNQRKPHFFHK